MNLYAESSAVLAWLLGENQRTSVQRLLKDADLIFTSDLTFVECDRVLIRAATLKEMSAARAESCRRRLTAASVAWYVLRVGADIVGNARQPFPGEPIRTLDALHLASAIVARTAVPDLAMLSLDNRIRSSAEQLGFVVVPPKR